MNKFTYRVWVNGDDTKFTALKIPVEEITGFNKWKNLFEEEAKYRLGGGYRELRGMELMGWIQTMEAQEKNNFTAEDTIISRLK